MEEGCFYFISDEFYEKYKALGVTGNDGETHGRPCCYMFRADDSDLYWMIPISSKVEKYQRLFDKSIQKYGICDNIVFGYVLGRKRAFLVQNLFPVTERYIVAPYLEKATGKPVAVDERTGTILRAKARKKIGKAAQGVKIGLTDVTALLEKMREEKAMETKNSVLDENSEK